MAATSILQQQEQQQQYKEASVQELHQSSTLVAPKDDSPSESDGSSCISASPDAAPAGSVKERGQPASNLYPTSSTCFGYYYPGYTGSLGSLDTQGHYIGGNIMDVQYPIMQAENGSFFYMMPGFHPNYNPYLPCLPLTTIGVEGQYVGDQVYPSNPTIQPPIASNGYALTSSIPYGELVSSPYPWDPSLVGHGYTNLSTPNHTHDPISKSSMLSDFTYHSFDVSSGHSNKLRTSNKALVKGPNLKSDLMAKSYFAVTKYPAYNNQRKSGSLYPNSLVNVKTHAELKKRSKASSGGDMNTLNEKKHGSELTNASDKLVFGYNNTTSLVRRDQYNLPDFEIKYDHAFFFVIKSYSEDDVHKSIKYNVWSSTDNGNRRLDSAYKEAQEKMTQKGSKCPVFLFFSVNASGQFCGLAEMIDRVDFEKNMGFWQQDKWSGYFPVKWHIIKDIPNSKLRHIILENYENKPVTNSRDTQEVNFNKGIEMLSIFKIHVTSISVLDDFDFYESRQKVLQENRIRQYVPHYDPQQKVKELTSNFQSLNVSTMEVIDGIQSSEKGKE